MFLYQLATYFYLLLHNECKGKTREGLQIIEEEVIFVSDLGKEKIFVGSNVSGPFSMLPNFQNFSFLKFIV